MSTPLRYRGISYAVSSQEKASDLPVPHIYRGRAFLAPLRHVVAFAMPVKELCYRGRPYVSHRGQNRPR